jgi:hypothetical protein
VSERGGGKEGGLVLYYKPSSASSVTYFFLPPEDWSALFLLHLGIREERHRAGGHGIPEFLRKFLPTADKMQPLGSQKEP